METRHVVVVLICVLSLSPAIAASGTSGIGTINAVLTTTNTVPPDPTTDTIGWEEGYWYNESIAIDQTDGLSGSELDAFLARSMARVEHIRRLEFTERVTIEFVRPDELSAPRNDTYGLSTSEQLWEALFFYGENTNASRVVRRAQRSAVLGYAAEEGSDHIVIVDPTPRRPTVSGGTLIHELAHMLQDQQFNLSRPQYQRHTLDGEFAKDGLVEGAAAYITDRYRMNCQRVWRCVGTPSAGSTVQRPAPFRFYRFTYFPYSAGEVYVRTLVEQGGWKAVAAAHDDPPVSTEQVIHPQRRNEQPIQLSFTNTARNGWTRIDEQPETIGEAGIYTLFWRRSADNSPISEANLSRARSTIGTYKYTSQPSTGWGNDRLHTYANGDKRGYVWKTVWDTERDAREFREAYIAILEEEGATRRGSHTWRIKNGPFADAFSVQRSGTVVTIVNGPTLTALNDIHPANSGERQEQSTETLRADEDNENKTTDEGTENTTTATTGPGFGGLAALIALVLAGIAIRRRG